MRIHHIGYIVRKIEKSIEAFEELGYKLTVESTWDEGRDAHICFLEKDGYCIELICPSKDSSLYTLLKRYDNAPYHICYMCDDLDKAINALTKKKYMMFKAPAAAPVIGKTARVAFLMSPRIGMIELVEEK